MTDASRPLVLSVFATFAHFIEPGRGWNLPGAPWYLGAFLLFIAMSMATRIPKLARVAASEEAGGGTEQIRR